MKGASHCTSMSSIMTTYIYAHTSREVSMFWTQAPTVLSCAAVHVTASSYVSPLLFYSLLPRELLLLMMVISPSSLRNLRSISHVRICTGAVVQTVQHSIDSMMRGCCNLEKGSNRTTTTHLQLGHEHMCTDTCISRSSRLRLTVLL